VPLTKGRRSARLDRPRGVPEPDRASMFAPS
jgi:hypothetical protein